MLGCTHVGSPTVGAERQAPHSRTWLAIGGLEYYGLAQDPGGIAIEEELQGRKSARLILNDRDGAINPASDITEGSAAVIVVDDVVVFRGRVQSHELRSIGIGAGHDAMFWSIDLVDCTEILDRIHVNDVFETPGQTAGDIVRQVVSSYLSVDRFSSSGVQDGLELSKAVFPWVSVTNVLDELARETGYHWTVGCDRVVRFFPRESYRSAWDITDTTKRHLELSSGGSLEQYRNREILLAGDDIQDTAEPEDLETDGKTTSWTLNRRIGEAPTVTVDGVPQTVGVQNLDEAQFYWSYGRDVLTQDRDETPVGAGQNLIVTYRGLIPLVAIQDDFDAQDDRIAVEGGSGIYEHVTQDRRINSADLARQRADGLLRQYGMPPRTIEYSTDRAGITVGSEQRVTLSEHGIDASYLVESVELIDLGHRNGFRYRVRAVAGNQASAMADFFRRLLDGGRDFAIRENEVLLKVVKKRDEIVFEDTVDAQTGNQLSAWDLDPYTVWIVGLATVGKTNFGTPTFFP